MLTGILFLALCAAALLPVAAAEAAVGLPALEEMVPLQPLRDVEVHTADTLWEKLNGEAELYRRFGLVRSVSASFGLGDPPERRVEVTVFELEAPLGAFGVFASFRSSGDRQEPLGNGAVVGENLAYFWHGRLFVLADATGPASTRAGDLRRAVVASALELGPPPPRPAELVAFEHLVDPVSVRFLPDHLLGRQSLPPGLEGETAAGLTVFVSTAPTPEGVPEEYGRLLSDARLLVWGRVTAVAGIDPAVGPVSVAFREGRLAGARARPEDPGVRQIVERLLEPTAALP